MSTVSLDAVKYFVSPLRHEAEKSLLKYHLPPYCLTVEPVKTEVKISGQSVTVYELTESDFRSLRTKSRAHDYEFFESAGGVIRRVVNMRPAA